MSDLALRRVHAAVVRRLGDARRGATAVEYGLIVALIAGACITVLTLFSQANSDVYSNMYSIIKAMT